jgi:hypothetical protein
MTNPSTSPPFQVANDGEQLIDLLLALDQVQHIYAWLVSHFEGVGPLGFLAPGELEEIHPRLRGFNINLNRLVVTSISERLRVSGWGGADGTAASEIWQRCDLDLHSRSAFNEALLLGRSALITWVGDDGHAHVSVESAQQVSVQSDPGTRAITAACKRWRTKDTTEAVLFLPDVIQKYRANAGSTTGGFNLVSEMGNPVGEVVVSQLTNGDRLPLYWGVTAATEFAYPERGLMGGSVRSEIFDVIPIQQAISVLIQDMLETSRSLARPRRWASGLTLIEVPRVDRVTGEPVLGPDGQQIIDVTTPIREGDRIMTAEDPAARFGSLDGASLDSYQKGVSVLVSQLQAVAALPSHYLGVLTQAPPSADALRASEAALVARVEEKQLSFGKGLQRMMRTAIAIEQGVDPSNVDVQVQWAPADTSSVAQESDAAVKLFSAGLLPRSYALRKLGYDDAAIAQIRTDTTNDVVAQKRGDPMSQWMNRNNPHLQDPTLEQ